MSYESAMDTPDIPCMRGERLLLLAMIRQAVQDLRYPEERDSALAWLMGETPSILPFSYVAEHLDLPIEVSRQRIIEYAESTEAGRAFGEEYWKEGA